MQLKRATLFLAHPVFSVDSVKIVYQCIKPRLSTKFGEHTTYAFSHADPQAWNDLPDEIRSVTNAATFKKHSKTHFLSSLFNNLYSHNNV